MKKSQYRVEIEFSRIQTYLFSSPKLKSMLGSQTNIAQIIRHDLPILAQMHGSGTIYNKHIGKLLPIANSCDPLQKAVTKIFADTNTDNNDQLLKTDDPRALYQQYGVLSRDGGHFRAIFPDEDDARNFIIASERMLAEKLPGLRATLFWGELDAEQSHPWCAKGSGETLLDHACFQVCQVLGKGPASHRTRQEDKTVCSSRESDLATQSWAKHRSDPQDVMALIQKAGVLADSRHQSLQDISPSGYLAVVHADGNDMGKRYQAWRHQIQNAQNLGYLAGEAHGEQFFHSMRVTVRKALVGALRQTFPCSESAQQQPSYQVLMLGGDDLLLVCSAEQALPFAKAYAKALCSDSLADDQPLTVGIGIAIAKDSFPFFRLHQIAEQLAGSAKQLFRANPASGSVIDWHVCTNSWIDDPVMERRMLAMRREEGQLTVLDPRPCPVLQSSGDAPPSLERLLEITAELQKTGLPRSSLRELVLQLQKGSSLGELAYQELPDHVRQILESAGGCGNPGVWTNSDAGAMRTSILPVLVELTRLSGLLVKSLKNKSIENN